MGEVLVEAPFSTYPRPHWNRPRRALGSSLRRLIGSSQTPQPGSPKAHTTSGMIGRRSTSSPRSVIAPHMSRALSEPKGSEVMPSLPLSRSMGQNAAAACPWCGTIRRALGNSLAPSSSLFIHGGTYMRRPGARINLSSSVYSAAYRPRVPWASIREKRVDAFGHAALLRFLQM
jgi:hypothetical protein